MFFKNVFCVFTTMFCCWLDASLDSTLCGPKTHTAVCHVSATVTPPRVPHRLVTRRGSYTPSSTQVSSLSHCLNDYVTTLCLKKTFPTFLAVT